MRYTFCSHLAMRGAPARAIQEPAGHQDLMTTQRYMHLSPAAVVNVIRLLEQGGPPKVSDDRTGRTPRTKRRTARRRCVKTFWRRSNRTSGRLQRCTNSLEPNARIDERVHEVDQQVGGHHEHG